LLTEKELETIAQRDRRVRVAVVLSEKIVLVPGDGHAGSRRAPVLPWRLRVFGFRVHASPLWRTAVSNATLRFGSIVYDARHDPGELAADRGRQTPQVPPKPMVTWLPSTITGTARRPLLNSSIRWSSAGFFFTLMYSNATCRR